MRPLTRKKQSQLFLAKVKELLLRHGAKQEEDRFILHTQAGPLVLWPTENRTEGVGTVFGRFDDPKAARAFVDCNPFSGKWNHHYFNGWTVEAAVENLAYWLGKVL